MPPSVIPRKIHQADSQQRPGRSEEQQGPRTHLLQDLLHRSVTLRWARVGSRGLPASGAGVVPCLVPSRSQCVCSQASPYLLIDLEGKLAQETQVLGRAAETSRGRGLGPGGPHRLEGAGGLQGRRLMLTGSSPHPWSRSPVSACFPHQRWQKSARGEANRHCSSCHLYPLGLCASLGSSLLRKLCSAS